MRKLSILLFALGMSIGLWAQTIPSGSNVSCGKNVRITATANEGYEFEKWSDDNTENPRTFTYNGTANPFTVVYGIKLFTVTANASATEGNILIELVP